MGNEENWLADERRRHDQKPNTLLTIFGLSLIRIALIPIGLLVRH
jgi:hypothetical protein